MPVPNEGQADLAAPLVIADRFKSTLVDDEKLDEVLQSLGGFVRDQVVVVNSLQDSFSSVFESHVLQETAEVEWQVQRVDSLAVELVVLTLGPLDEEPKQFISLLVLVQILELLEV